METNVGIDVSKHGLDWCLGVDEKIQHCANERGPSRPWFGAWFSATRFASSWNRQAATSESSS